MSRTFCSKARGAAWAICLGLTLASQGCGKSKAEAKPEHAEKPHEEHAAEPAEQAGEAEPPKEARKRKRKRAKEEAPPPNEARRYAVPFVWETAADDPLARTRAHMKELLGDNARYAKERGSRYFDAFAEGQKPRTTVVTCSDSRIQMPAFDATPENDLFVIRNIGNQLETAFGSIEYGVEHLRTAVLLIVGHTGCGAVKAALGKLDALSDPIRQELSPMRLSHHGSEEISDELWAESVVENVHNQVKTALDRFSSMVQDGKLTVVGGVYDFRNDLKLGSGRLVLVNVNGNSETASLEAFGRAIGADAKVLPQARSATAEGVTREVHQASKEEKAPSPVAPEVEHAGEAAAQKAHGQEKAHSNPLREPTLH